MTIKKQHANSKYKYTITGILILVIVISLCACSGGVRTETDYMTVDGIYVNNDYQDDNLKMVYLVYTLHAKENLEVDSTYMYMTIDNKNEYESEIYSNACKYMDNIYYSGYLEDLYTDDSMKVVATFKVPEADLDSGKSIKLEDSQIPDIEKISLRTDDIINVSNTEELAAKIDPEGFAKESEKREPADESMAQKVRNSINGYYFTFYANPASYRLEFFAPNNFEIESTINGSTISNTGTYTVQKGYVSLYYSSSGNTVDIPYDFGSDGEINLYAAEAFAV